MRPLKAFLETAVVDSDCSMGANKISLIQYDKRSMNIITDLKNF